MRKFVMPLLSLGVLVALGGESTVSAQILDETPMFEQDLQTTVQRLPNAPNGAKCKRVVSRHIDDAITSTDFIEDVMWYELESRWCFKDGRVTITSYRETIRNPAMNTDGLTAWGFPAHYKGTHSVRRLGIGGGAPRKAGIRVTGSFEGGGFGFEIAHYPCIRHTVRGNGSFTATTGHADDPRSRDCR